MHEDWKARITQVRSDTFDSLAMDIFRYQASQNTVYSRYLALLGVEARDIHSPEQIPGLPIQLFKGQDIQTNHWETIQVFTSSGTTGQIPSRHLVHDLNWYLQTTRRLFEAQYGDLNNWCVLALLPSYLERSGSSLVAMADYFIQCTKQNGSGFYLNNASVLVSQARRAHAQGCQVLVLGVSFALLDMGDLPDCSMPFATIMETGGMKGRRQEITRQELHETLCRAFGVPQIHSEYGMTELFSQAYAPHDGMFLPPQTMRVYSRDVTDPFSNTMPQKPGSIQIIDLANIDTCCFLATEDLGIVYPDGRFQILGRLDTSETRGCNLLLTS